MKKTLTSFVFAVTCLFLSTGQPALAAGGSSNYTTGSSSKQESEKPEGYKKAVKLLGDEKYEEANKVLNSLLPASDQDADVHNLIAFSYRKSGQLDQAETHYKKALTLDPEHRGALEYQGELFLTQGRPDKAENNLRKLGKICGSSCKEYKELSEAIENGQ